MMNNKEMEELERLRIQRKKQIDRQNKFAAEKYDRITIAAPKGYKDKITQAAAARGYDKVTPYLMQLIDADIALLEADAGAPRPAPEERETYRPRQEWRPVTWEGEGDPLPFE